MIKLYLLELGGLNLMMSGQQQRRLHSYVEARQVDPKGAMANLEAGRFSKVLCWKFIVPSQLTLGNL